MIGYGIVRIIKHWKSGTIWVGIIGMCFILGWVFCAMSFPRPLFGVFGLFIVLSEVDGNNPASRANS